MHESFFNVDETDYVSAARRDGRLVVLCPDRPLGVSKYSWSVGRVERAVRWGRGAGEGFLRARGDAFFGG